MTPQEVFGLLAGRFGADVGPLVAGEAGADAGLPKGYRALTPFAWVKPARIRDVCRYCHDALGFDSLSCLSGVDAKGLAKDHPDEIWVAYHLSSVSSRDAFALKVRLDRADPRLPSIHDVWGVANWHEREAYDMFGIVFEGHPNLTRILCCDDWVGWPLRKDYAFPKEYHGIPHARRPSPSWTGPAPWEKAE